MNGRNGAIHSAPQHAAPAGCQNMKNNNSKLFSARVASTILVLLAAFVLVPQAMAQMPAAGTKIGNSAKATYTDPAGQARTVTSNVVETKVKAVYSVSLEESQTTKAPPGAVIYFPHLVRNQSNDEDTYALSATNLTGAEDDADAQDIKIFADADRDGIADTATAITTTGKLLAGGTFGLLVQVTIASSANDGEDIKIKVEADNGRLSTDNAKDDNADTVTVDDDASNIRVTKKLSTATARAGDTVTVTLSYVNNSAVGSELQIEDDLKTLKWTYAQDSTEWSFAAGTIDDGVTKAADALSSLTLAVTEASGNVRYTISSVAANTRGTISFEVTVPADTVTGTVLENYAKYLFDDSGDGSVNSSDDSTRKTNKVTLTVGGAADLTMDVTIADARATSSKTGATADDAANLVNTGADIDTSTTDDDNTRNDDVRETGTHQPGATVDFEFVLTNLGAAGRVNFVLDVDTTDPFPSGTVFSIDDDKGVVLTDTDGDGYLDTAIGAQSHLKLMVRAVLPVTATRADSDAAWAATIEAVPTTTNPVTKQNDPSDKSTLSLAGGVGSSVDLINRDDSVSGDGTTLVDPDGDGGVGNAQADETNANAPFTTLEVDPGQAAVFKLRLTPTMGLRFALEASFATGRLTDGIDDGFAADSLTAAPTGVLLVFKDLVGNTITSTGLLSAGTAFDFEAHVTVGSQVDPASLDIRFRAYSTTVAGMEDQKLDRLLVGEVIDLSLYPPESLSTITAGQSAVYAVDLRNNGNVDIAEGAIATSTPPANYTVALHYDVNENGVVDAGEAVVDNVDDVGGVVKRASKQLILTLTAPLNVDSGTLVTISVTVAKSLVASDNSSVDDRYMVNNAAAFQTTIVNGLVILETEQGVDANCDGTIEGAFDKNSATSPTPIGPGNCIQYKITASIKYGPATSVIVVTRTPPYTKLETCVDNSSVAQCAVSVKDNNAVAVSGVTLTGPLQGQTGHVQVVLGDLVANTVRVLRFTVKVDA